MRVLNLAACGLTLAGLLAPAAARADNVVARWIQVGPGSSAAALAAGQYGDQPLSATPTLLARAVVSDGACPSLVLDGSMRLTMATRFTGAQLTNDPGTTGYTNANTASYPQYFVSPTATAPGTFPDGTAKATTAWAECEAVVPAGHTIATVGGVDLKLRSPLPSASSSWPTPAVAWPRPTSRTAMTRPASRSPHWPITRPSSNPT